MKRSWNWLLPLGFLVVLAAFLSYFLFFAQFPLTRDFPWANLLLFAGGLALLGVGLKRAFGQPQLYRGKITGSILGVLSLLVLGSFLFYNFSFSQDLPASPAAPKVGYQAPDFTLPPACAAGGETNGDPVTLSELWNSEENQWVLLVFYRGYW